MVGSRCRNVRLWGLAVGYGRVSLARVAGGGGDE